MAGNGNDNDKPRREESKAEAAKRDSRQLRGTIAQALASDATHFNEDDALLLKFHGIYQCVNRDNWSARRDAGQEAEYFYMVRVAIPGGVLTAEQYLALDRIADECANGSLRITTRQGIQFHAVYKPRLAATLAGIGRHLMTTLAACGDVERNVMTCPAPLADEPHRLVRELAGRIARELRPATRAYREIWLGGEKAVSAGETEPFYGEQYLPRKFKTGVALATDNSVDVYSDDCGLIALVEDGRVSGFNVLVGGGQGMTHNRADTFVTLAQPIAFVGVEHAVEAVRAVAAIFRDHGNRADRKHARLKYLIAEWGLPRFCEEFRRRVSFPVAPPVTLPRPEFHDFLGWQPQQDGKWFYGVFVPNGRVVDRPEQRTRSALRSLVERYQPGVCVTPHQNLLLTNLDESALQDVEQTLSAHGVKLATELSGARRYSVACPALPTCGVALTEAERALPQVVARLERELAALGLEGEPLTLRMTGCPNGCARPYTADIGLVGRKPGERYNVYVGGGLAGDRIADLYAADVHIDDLIAVLHPLLAEWGRQRRAGEGFSDFYQRLLGRTTPRNRLSGVEDETKDRIPLGVTQ